MLGQVRLAERGRGRVRSYSMGMRQRLGIARALLADPRLVVLDEASNGLDPAGIREFRALTRALADEGRTVILSTHLLAEVERSCDDVTIMDGGRIVAHGPIEQMRGSQGLESLFLELTETPGVPA